MYASIDRVSDVVSRKLRKIKEKDGGHGRTWQMRGVPRVGELISDEPDNITPMIEREPEKEDMEDEVTTRNTCNSHECYFECFGICLECLLHSSFLWVVVIRGRGRGVLVTMQWRFYWDGSDDCHIMSLRR